MNFGIPPPPFPAGTAAQIASDEYRQPQTPPHSNDLSLRSFVVVAFIVAIAAFVTSTAYCLIRFLSHRFRRRLVSSSSSTPAAADTVVIQVSEASSGRRRLVDSLPAFAFGSVDSGGSNAKDRDCAICLARFQPHDLLRLLPICCHAFHADCVDAWLEFNRTCPLCRSPVLASEAEINKALLSETDAAAPPSGGRLSFRVEIGSLSSRQRAPFSDATGDGRTSRSFSIGSFDYVIDDGDEALIALERTQRSTSTSSEKDEPEAPQPPGPSLAAEVAAAGQRSWLREYVDRLASTASSSSRALSFRSSGRFFFTGSSRRSEVAAVDGDEYMDAEGHRIGEEISEMFRWLSGV